MESKYFTEDEMKCQHCGDIVWDEEFMQWLDIVRYECGFPFVVTSGYRCPEHPIEKRKKRPGSHSTGRAVDISASGPEAIKIIEVASKHGCVRIGVNQNTFIHLDRDKSKRPALWTY